MIYPIALNFLGTTSDSMSFQNIDIDKEVEIPIDDHVGSFGVKRKFDRHMGIDLYTERHEMVYAMESGIVTKIDQFTGLEVGSPWWNKTYFVRIEGESGIIEYCEILPILNESCVLNSHIKEGQPLGVVIPVLKKDKGRPRSMLHLQYYTQEPDEYKDVWELDGYRPQYLTNPIELLKDCKVMEGERFLRR